MAQLVVDFLLGRAKDLRILSETIECRIISENNLLSNLVSSSLIWWCQLKGFWEFGLNVSSLICWSFSRKKPEVKSGFIPVSMFIDAELFGSLVSVST